MTNSEHVTEKHGDGAKKLQGTTIDILGKKKMTATTVNPVAIVDPFNITSLTEKTVVSATPPSPRLGSDRVVTVEGGNRAEGEDEGSQG